MALKKITLFPLFPRYLTLTTYFESTLPLRFQKTRGLCCIPFALREKQNYQVSHVRVKSKILGTLRFKTRRL